MLASFSGVTVEGIAFSGKIWLVNGVLHSLEFVDATEHVNNRELESLNIGPVT